VLAARPRCARRRQGDEPLLDGGLGSSFTVERCGSDWMVVVDIERRERGSLVRLASAIGKGLFDTFLTRSPSAMPWNGTETQNGLTVSALVFGSLVI
jgi:hypothetical protein